MFVTVAATEDPTLWDVVEEHLDESDFLLEQWLNTTRSARLGLPDLHRAIEHRLLAHLDALATGGSVVADRLLWPTLAEDSEAPSTRVAAAVLALLADPGPSVAAWQDPLRRVLDTLLTPRGAAVHEGLAAAFQMTPRSDIDEPLRQALYAAGEQTLQVALLTALAARRVNVGPVLPTLLQHTEVPIVAAALQAAPCSDRGPVRHLVERLLEHPDSPVRAEALRTGLILNLDPAWRACVVEARRGAPGALLGLSLFGGPGELDLVAALARSGPHRKAAVRALGASGRPDAVEACLPFLSDTDPQIAALALEAIATVTDLPWTETPYSKGAPDDLQSDDALPPLDEDLETDLAPSDDDDLPAPNPPAVERWWSDNRGRFRGDGRFLTGLPLSSATMRDVLLACPLRRVAAMALDVAVRTGGRIQIPALRLRFVAPELPSDLRLTRPPIWS